MKRTLRFMVFILIFLLLFSSCNSVSEPPVVPSETSSPSETVKPTEKSTETEPLYYTDDDNNLLVREFGFSIDNYSDYQKFISEVNLPDHFVKYEDISILGNFKRFYIYQSDPDTTKKEKFHSINYEIEAKHGYVFTVTIGPRSYSDILDTDYEIYEKDIIFANMRTILNAEEYDGLLKNTSLDVVVYNYSSNLRYAYLIPEGRLLNMRLYHGEIEFIFRILGDYPDVLNDPISKLLNIEDNDPAEIVASITKNIKAE